MQHTIVSYNGVGYGAHVSISIFWGDTEFATEDPRMVEVCNGSGRDISIGEALEFCKREVSNLTDWDVSFLNPEPIVCDCCNGAVSYRFYFREWDEEDLEEAMWENSF